MKAVYAGSFDCYTNGHHDIVHKARNLFSELHIVIAVNSVKKRSYPAELMAASIEKLLKAEGLDNCIVSIWKGLVAEYCATHGIFYSVRGLRNSMDYNYEESVASVNKLIMPNLETVYFRSDTPAISSSMVRELHSFGRDISSYVPKEIWECIKLYKH